VTGKPAAEVGRERQPTKAVGKREKKNQMSKGGKVDQFHE
jgi:hypothetical protein